MNAAKNGPAIAVRALEKHYPVIKDFRELILHPLTKKRVTALAGIDLDVECGRCFCLLGPNGAGKTTLIKVLATLVLPDSGAAYVNGYDVEKDPKNVKCSVGLAIPEERSFYWRLTGRQNLDFFSVLSNIPGRQRSQRIGEVLQLVNLEKAADFRFNTYSTGMKQMLSFARALLADVKILFVDEPTRSLDPQSAKKIRKFIREELVGRQGRTVFWATHNLNEAFDYADDLAIINKGRIRLQGAPLGLTGNGRKSLQEVYEETVEAPTESLET